MPNYDYRAAGDGGCEYCRAGFEHQQPLRTPPLATCPRCGGPVRKVIRGFGVGRSESGFQDRACGAGFSFLKKQSDGTYHPTSGSGS